MIVIYAHVKPDGSINPDNLIQIEPVGRDGIYFVVVNGGWYLNVPPGEIGDDVLEGSEPQPYSTYRPWTPHRPPRYRKVLVTTGRDGNPFELARARVLSGEPLQSFEDVLAAEAQAANPETPFDIDRYEAMACAL